MKVVIEDGLAQPSLTRSAKCCSRTRQYCHDIPGTKIIMVTRTLRGKDAIDDIELYIYIIYDACLSVEPGRTKPSERA